MKQPPSALPIHRLGTDPVVRFACSELARYWAAMTGMRLPVRAARRYEPGAPGFWVGLAADFETPARETDGSDDVVFVQAERGHAILSGANPRSVLYAVYRYLEKQGCRWFRPGPGGERVPRVADPWACPVALLEIPSARHRCICMEGACSDRHVRDMIDYAAKRGFNAYFTQFRNAYTFYQRWYGVETRRGRPPAPFSSARALAYQEKAKREALRRGLLLHTVGHGWTCEPFGIRGEEWAPTKQAIPATIRPFLALLNGHRDLHKRIPLNTQLCYSQPRVRRIVTEAIVAYAKAHPHEAIIHFWLADGSNNHCECPACRKARPSDWYVRMLNELDAGLTRAGLDTRIVFLAYVDLLWPPRRERIRHPERFILMFAPITRSYGQTLRSGSAAKRMELPRYVRNKLRFSASTADNLALLDGWRRRFSGECVDFDYHLWRALYADPGQMRLARVLHRDAADLGRMGMDGFISCQCQRVAFPTGLFMEVLGRALWDASTSFDQIVARYFTDLFGPDGEAVRRYLSDVSDTLSEDRFRPPANRPAPVARARQIAAGSRWNTISARVAAMAPRIRRGMRRRDPVAAAAWRMLHHHAWYLAAMTDFWSKSWSGDPAAAAVYRAMDAELNRRLPELHPVFDTWMCRLLMQQTLRRNGITVETPAPAAERKR